MAMLHVEVNAKDVLQKLAQVEQLGKNFSDPLQQSGLYMLRSTDKVFRQQYGPNGEIWPNLKPATLKARAKGWNKSGGPGMMLLDTGRLRNSLSPRQNSEGIFRLETHSVEVGTNLKYANIHQFGGVTIHRAAGRTITLRRTKKNQVRFTSPNSKKYKKTYTKNVEWAEYRVRIPARPYLGITPANQKMVNQIFGIWMNKNLNENKAR